MKVRHLRQRKRHLPGVAHGAVPVVPVVPVFSRAALMGRRRRSVLQSAHVLRLLLRVAVDVGPRLGQRGDRVQGEAGRALVGRGVGHLGVTAAALEAGSEVLAGRPVGVGGRPVVDIQ